MHLIELYAKDLGVKIGKPIIQEHFFPITHNKYITIHNDKKVPSKFYKYWEDVIYLFKEQINDYKFVQVGAQGEDKLPLVDEHWPTTSFKQLFYIIKRASAHVGIDSVPVHIASSYNVPTVSLYSHTHPNTCRPYWNDCYKILESDREGNLPSFVLDENPHYMDRINPDRISQALLDVLKLNKTVSQKTIYIGPQYGVQMIDVVPLAEPAELSGNVNVRMDIHFNENVLNNCLARSLCEITTNKPINTNLVNHSNVKIINYIAPHFDPDFVKTIKSSGKNFVLLCNDKKTINNERAKFFDFNINFYCEKEKVKDLKSKFKSPDQFSVASKKMYICGDKKYVTKYDLNNRKDIDDLWIDIDWMRVYTT